MNKEDLDRFDRNVRTLDRARELAEARDDAEVEKVEEMADILRKTWRGCLQDLVAALLIMIIAAKLVAAAMERLL